MLQTRSVKSYCWSGSHGQKHCPAKATVRSRVWRSGLQCWWQRWRRALGQGWRFFFFFTLEISFSSLTCFIASCAHTPIPRSWDKTQVCLHETVHGCFSAVICFHFENIKIARWIRLRANIIAHKMSLIWKLTGKEKIKRLQKAGKGYKKEVKKKLSTKT